MDREFQNKKNRIKSRVKDVLSSYPPDSIITDPLGQYTGVPNIPDKKEDEPSAKIYIGNTDLVEPIQDVDDL